MHPRQNGIGNRETKRSTKAHFYSNAFFPELGPLYITYSFFLLFHDKVHRHRQVDCESQVCSFFPYKRKLELKRIDVKFTFFFPVWSYF